MPEQSPKPSSVAPAKSNQSPATVTKVRTTFTGRWRPFANKTGTYDLEHLKDQIIRYEKPAQDDNPARIYNVEVEFSSHCFTRDPHEAEVIDTSLIYPGENRLFDFERYELSKMLPEILKQLPLRSCYQTGVGNFFSIDIQEKGSYEIYFKVDKTGKGRLKLFVQSAYLRDSGHGASSKGYPIRFLVVLYNKLHGKPIKITPAK